jgi:N-formylglutamate amidohydrolase
MPHLIPDVVERLHPEGTAVPVVFDSPHSGKVYPEDFGHSLALEKVRRFEDAFIDELYASATSQGAVLIRALFPRSYIDPNRAPDDIDESMLASPWDGELNPGPKTHLGVGLIPRREPGGPMYERMLGLEEVKRRIDGYWRPYHEAVRTALDEVHHRFGAVWHVNCHSMPAISTEVSAEGPGIPRPDICLGDRDGSTCDPAFTAAVADGFSSLGYGVTVNDPYKGVELVRRYSDPSAGRHSLQVEINRKLYMDEERIKKNGGFESLEKNIATVVAAICAFAGSG